MKTMCNCATKAIEKGFIIRGAIYNEQKFDFVDTNDFYMPLNIRDEKGKYKPTKLAVKRCPICGQALCGK